MAIDPRLMMSDFSGFARAGQNIGKGIQGYQMNQINNLAGEALMLDPAAMEELKARSPQMAAQVQQQLQEQQAKQQQAEFESERQLAEELRTAYGEMNAQDFASFRDQLNAGMDKGLYPALARKREQTGDQVDEDDYLVAQLFSGKMDEKTFDQAMKLRAETRPYVQEFTDAKSTLNGLLSITQPGASATDQVAAIFQFMKALDPNSVVREGEQTMVMRTDGVFGTMGNYLQRLMNGQSLNQKQLNNLAQTALKGFEGRAKALSEQVNYQVSVGDKFGISGELIAPADIMNIDETVNSYRESMESRDQQEVARAASENGGDQVVIQNHPTLGNVTMADIRETAKANNMTEDQVIQQLRAQ